MTYPQQKAFTLLEILLVIAAIGVLAAIVIVAINPQQQLAQVRDADRVSGLNSLAKALNQYLIDEGQYPVGITEVYQPICRQDETEDCLNFRDTLVSPYLPLIPQDPSEDERFFAAINPDNQQISLVANGAEAKDTIIINQTATPVSEGLMLHLDATDPESYPGSGNIWYDLSEYAEHATLVGDTTYSPDYGGSFVFPNGDSYIDTNQTATDLGAFDSEYTMIALFVAPPSQGENMIFGTATPTSREGLHHGVRSSRFHFGHFGNDAGSPNNFVSPSTWYWGAWIWNSDSPRAQIWIDNSMIGSSNANSFIGTTNIQIGKSYGTPSFGGHVSQILIYDRALSPEELNHNFLITRHRLVAQ